jgi:hypothetical protein
LVRREAGAYPAGTRKVVSEPREETECRYVVNEQRDDR